jgi:hypothetical protein
VRASQAGDGTYQPATDVDQSFTVGKAVLTVQATNATRAYNQSNPALTVSYSGFVNGEGLPTSGVTGTPSVSTTATSSSAPGTYPITAAVGTLASAKYSFSFSAGTLTLGKADQTISFGALTNGTYGDGARTLAATASSGLAATYAVVSGPASLSGNTLTITSAGTVIVRASQAGNANYNPATDVDQSFTVAKAVLSVTAADANRPVGQPDPTFMATYSGFVNSEALATSGVAGSPALSTTATSGSAAGTYPITAAIGTLAAANYSFSFVAGTLTVGKQAQTITFGALANGTYGESARTLGGTASSALPVSYVVVSGPATLSGSTLTVTGVGTVVVRASQSGDGTYNAAADVDQSFTVGKATLVVKADDASRAYGQANSTLSASYSGFVNSENLATSGVTGSPTLSTTATSSSAAGTYAITAALGTLTSANYGFNFSPGALSVGKADQTITFGALANGTYGESGRTLGATASSNLSVSFVVANGPGVFSGSTLIITGTGTIVVRASQAGSANYNAAADVYQSFTVAKAVVTITADNASRLVGQSNPTFTATYTGFVNGETLVTSGISGGPTLSSTADSESNSGTYPITVTAGSLSAANYSFSFVAGSLSVGLQSQTISFGALANGTYGDSSRTLSATASSSLPVSYVVVSGPASVSGNTLTFTGTGTVVVRASQAGNSTYEPAANVDQSFVIQKAVVNVTPVNVSRVSGQSNPTFSATYAGFVASETLANSGISGAPALSSTATSSSPAGSYPITAAAGSLSAANYSFTFSSGTLTVTVAINQAPSFAIAGPAKVMEDAGPQSITSFATSINPGDPSESGQALDFQLSVDQPLLFKVQPTLAADGTLTFTSAPDQNGTAIVTVLLHDDGGVANGGHDASATQTFQIVITPQNDPPKAVTDLASTSGRDPVTMNVLANDTDPEGDVLHLVSATLKGGRGEVTVATGGEVTFTAAAGFHGEATIQYVVADASGAEAQGLFIVQVNAIPEASPDAAHVARNDSVTINVLANDADADADDVLAITKVTCDAGLGQAVRSLDGKTIVFTPALNLIGLATFTYTVSDDHGGSAEATVTVTIDDAVVNLPPVAVADHATTAFGTPVSVPVLANDSDPEGGVLALGTVTVDAIFGTVTVAGTTVLFTPAPAFSGTATVRYQAIDPAGNITDSVALVEVVPAPAPPIAFDDTGRAQAGSTTNFHVLQNDLAPDGGALTLIAASLVDPTQGVVAINNDGTIAFTPAAGFIGQTRIGYTVSSVGALTASAFLTVDVVAVLENSAPQPVNDTGSTQPGKASTLFPLANDSDPEGDLLTLANVTFAPEEGTITFTPEGAVTFTPAPGFTGLATLFYTVTDPTGATATATITVIVNTLPIALPDRLATAPGQALSANVLTNDSDADGHALHVSAFSTDPALGTLTIAANGALQYAPAPGVTGVASFTYTLEDELGGVAEGQIFITVNSAPLAVNDLADIPPDMAASIDVLQNDSDPNGDPLRVVAATIDPALGTVAINDDGTLLYTPASGVRGNVVITYFIADRFGVLSSATLTLTVGDRAPTTTDRTVYGFCYVPLRINALRGAEDPEGGALRVIALTQPRSGHVTISANGYVIFKPRLAMNNPNFQDSFTVTVEDSAGGRSTMTVTVLSLNALKGGYLGLMEPSSTPFPSPAQNVQLAEPLGGMVTVTMGNGATFSGVLRRGTTRVAFHGRLDGSFSYTRKVAIARWPQARLHLTYSPADKSFAAKLLGTDADLIAATGLRRVQPTKARTSSAVLRLGDPALGENATGSISVTVRKNGLAVYRGYLPDGRAFTGGTGYLGAGEIPTYRGFRATRLFARGYAGGTIHFDAVVSSTDLNGSLRQDFGTLRMLDLEPMP